MPLYYLFLVRNDIKSVESLISYQVLKESKVERISTRQKEIYKESGIRKRACKTEEDIRDFQVWHGLKKIIVCTNSNLVAPRNYESVGFILYDRKTNASESAYTGDYLYYEIIL